MAKHVFPDRENKPWLSLITNPKLQTYAFEADKLLSRLPQLKVWEIQYKRGGYDDNALYIGMTTKSNPYLLNFKIIPSNLCIEFRFSQYLPIGIFESLKWQCSSWRYADLKTFGRHNVTFMIDRYIENISPDFKTESLRPGGSSFIEKMILTALNDIFPGIWIDTNIRPDNLRSPKNRPLELDLYLDEKKLAIEIQGPQHFKEVYGNNTDLKNNDQFKKQWCRKNNIKLIWINWEGVNILMKNKKPVDFLKNYLQNLINHFLISEYSFLWWKNPDNQHWE